MVCWLAAACHRCHFRLDEFRISSRAAPLRCRGSLSVPPRRVPDRAGGIFPILVSTICVVLIALTASVPLGLATAIWLSEFARKGNGVARITHLSLDILAGIPSIVFGLFGYAFFSTYFRTGILTAIWGVDARLYDSADLYSIG